jgi:hypothetical protein
MLWQHLAELHSGGPRGLHGSGYLLAPGLLLTARHVVDGLEEPRVRLIEPDEDGLPADIGDWQSARVAWTGDDIDLALLTPLSGQPSFRESIGALTIARLGGRVAVRVDALGFPRALLTPKHSDTLHLEATVNPWSNIRGEALLLDVGTTRPAAADGWKGMSGAAVFGGDRLVGVIEAVPGQLDASTLRATPAHGLFGVAKASELIRDAGVELASQFVDAGYVDALPRVGHWGGVREQYTRAVIREWLRIDDVGLGVRGVAERQRPAISAFRAHLRSWPESGAR